MKSISRQWPWNSCNHSYETILTEQVRERTCAEGLSVTHCCQSSSYSVLDRSCESKLLQEQRRGSPSIPHSTAKRLCQKQCCQQSLFILLWPEWQENIALPVQMLRRPMFTCLGVEALLFILLNLAFLRLFFCRSLAHKHTLAIMV